MLPKTKKVFVILSALLMSGYGIVHKIINSSDELKLLSQESGFKVDYKKGTLGNKYGSVLKSHNGNSTRWNEAFNRLSEELKKDSPSVSSHFKNLSGAFGTTPKYLNIACSNLYQSPTFISNGRNIEEQKEKDFWKYCSMGSSGIKTLEEKDDEKYAKDTLGDDYKTLLVSTKSKDFNWFWIMRARNFLSAVEKMEISEKSSFGKLLRSAKNDENIGAFIKSECSYQYAKNSISKEDKEIVLKFCSLSSI